MTSYGWLVKGYLALRLTAYSTLCRIATAIIGYLTYSLWTCKPTTLQLYTARVTDYISSGSPPNVCISVSLPIVREELLISMYIRLYPCPLRVEGWYPLLSDKYIIHIVLQ